MNTVSSCCSDSVAIGTKMEYPLGGSTWGIGYKTEVCDLCHSECDTVTECEYCGELLHDSHAEADCKTEYERISAIEEMYGVKVGDEVVAANGKIGIVEDMEWHSIEINWKKAFGWVRGWTTGYTLGDLKKFGIQKKG